MFFLFIFTLCVPVLGNREENHIVGGRLAKPGEVPYQLKILDSDESFCGASILDEYHFLTAGHCATERTKGMKVFTLSCSYDLPCDEDSVVFDVDEVYTNGYVSHERTEWVENDIAIGRIKGKFVWNEYVQPIGLREKPAAVGSECVVSGWGLLKFSEDYEALPNGVQVTTVRIRDLKECESEEDEINEDQICAGNEHHSICDGDSGGGLVCDGFLTGIASTAYEICIGPDLYTDVVYHKHWIQSTLDKSYSKAGIKKKL